MQKNLIAIVMVLSSLGLVLMPVEAQAKCGGNGGQVAGAVVGGVLGGLLGRSVAGGRDKTLGTVLGGALGVVVGSRIGKSLDRCEQEKMATATEAALNAKGSDQASTQKWTSETRPGVGGTVVASTPQAQPDGRVCRNVSQVNYVDGQEMKDNPRFCRTPPSSAWAPA